MNVSSIYDDLYNTDLGDKVLKLQESNQKLVDHIKILDVDIHKLCGELTKMKAEEANLKRNISELYNTAKVEIERKNRMIADLRRQLDDLLFKRQNSYPNTSGYPFNINMRNREEVSSENRTVNKLKSEPVTEHHKQQETEGYRKCTRETTSGERRIKSKSPSSRGRERSRSQSKFKTRDHNQKRRKHQNECSRGNREYDRRCTRSKSNERNREFNSKDLRYKLKNRSSSKDRGVFKNYSNSDRKSNSVIKEASVRNLDNCSSSNSSKFNRQEFHKSIHSDLKNGRDVQIKLEGTGNIEKVKTEQEINDSRSVDVQNYIIFSSKSEAKDDDRVPQRCSDSDTENKLEFDPLDKIKLKDARENSNTALTQDEGINSSIKFEWDVKSRNCDILKSQDEVVLFSTTDSNCHLSTTVVTENKDTVNGDITRNMSNSKGSTNEPTNGALEQINLDYVEMKPITPQIDLQNREIRSNIANSRKRKRCIIKILN